MTTVKLISLQQRGTMVLLLGAGLAMHALLAGLILLYVNFPAGYNVPFGLSLESLPLFRTLWAYPVLVLEWNVFAVLAIFNILVMWGVYLGAVAIGRGCRCATIRRQMVLVVAAFALLYNATLMLAMPPVLSADIYHYALFGRMVTFYSLNPYVVPGDAISGDPLWPFVFWRNVTTHYGPVWTLISAGAAALGGQSVLLTVLWFKGVATLFNLANGVLVFLLARRLTGGDGLVPLLLYAWNPLILVETAGSGHNDAAMMTFALLGLLLAMHGRTLVGLAVLLLSVMVKYLTAVLLLFFVIRCLAKEGTCRRAATLAARMGAVAVLLVGVLYLPFWAGPEGLARLTTVGAPFKTPVRVFLRDAVTRLWASGAASQVQAAAEVYVVWGLHLGFVALVLLRVKALATPQASWSQVLEAWGVTSLVYVMIVYGWNFPWYLIPTLTTTCVGPPTRTTGWLLAWSSGLGIGFSLLYTVLVRV